MIKTVAGHSWSIETGVRELPPEDGWRRRESAGDLSMTCGCGVEASGPADLARPMIKEHLRAAVPEADWPDWLRP